MNTRVIILLLGMSLLASALVVDFNSYLGNIPKPEESKIERYLKDCKENDNVCICKLGVDIYDCAFSFVAHLPENSLLVGELVLNEYLNLSCCLSLNHSPPYLNIKQIQVV